MAPKAARNHKSPPSDPDGMFAGMIVLLVSRGVQNRRLQIWKQKLVQMGASIESRVTKSVTHILAMNSKALLEEVGGSERLGLFKGSVVLYQWLQDSLSSGEKVSEDLYLVKLEEDKSSNDSTESPYPKKTKFSPENLPHTPSTRTHKALNEDQVTPLQPYSAYSPPDLNSNITQIFGKLINIYRALGDDRRSFSYSKAIPVIERLPFKIKSQDQVKGLSNIGKAMQEHIQEIVTTGKLSKLEHFETDEKIRTISLFGEVWGIGPATAQKLYEKGHRTLDDLKNEGSLTNAQQLGLKYFDDIRKRIPRNEAQEMVCLLEKAGEDVLPGVVIVCGGSYRRGKASCGDLDIIITHPDGNSHIGFLTKYVKHLKDMMFLREDLVFSTHSEEDTGVDTYFGLCTYPGRELRHRIDIKVYPRELYAFALVHWTGNDVLNRRLRVLAESKGFLLDDDGLFPATWGNLGQRGMRGSASLKFDSEREVFDFLGLPWLEPHDRNL